MKLMKRNLTENPMWLPEIFDNFFVNDWSPVVRNSGLPINVKESSKDYSIEIAVPGMSKENFSLTINKNLLTLKMEKETKNEEKEHTYLRRDFMHRSFHQCFNIPEDVDKEKITACVKHGILLVELPKQEVNIEKGERTIEIQ